MASPSASDVATASPSEVAIQAAIDGNLSLLKMMASKVNLREVKDDKGRNALYLASEKGHLEICRFLVEDSGLDVDSVSAEGRRPVHGAAAGGSDCVLRYLLDRGGDPVVRDSKDKTPLHDAAEEGHCEAVRLLLSKGVNVDAVSSFGTPLHLAASKDKDQALKILLEHGADPNKAFNQYITPLLVASCGAHSLKCTKLLVEAGADVNFMSPGGPIILMGAVDDGSTDIVKFLLEAGADPNIPDEHGRIPIICAAIHGKQELVELLFPRTKPIPNHMDWNVDRLIRSMKLLNLDAIVSQGAFLEKELLSDPGSRGKETFANGNNFEALYLYGLDSPPPREEITTVYSGSIGGEGLRTGRECSGYLRHSGGRGGLLDLLEETFYYCGWGGGGLRDILDESVNHMVAPIKLCGSHGRGEERLLMFRFPKKILAGQAQGRWSLWKKILEMLKSQKRKQPAPAPKPAPKPYVRTPREEETIQPKPMSKVYQLYKDIHSALTRFFGYLGAQVPIAILFLFGFCAALGSTLSVWYDRNQSFVVNFAHPGNKMVLVADDIFGCQKSRLELIKVCNLGTCDVVIPVSVIRYLESRSVGIESLKTAPALRLIEDLLEAHKVRIFQDPMNPDYMDNLVRTVLILKFLYPGSVVTIASNNKMLRS